MPSRTYTFADPTQYIYSDLIEIVDDKFKLSLQQGDIDYTEDFADDTGFTYDNTKAEFTGGLVRQTDQIPTDATFGATYDNSVNGSFGDGITTGAVFGSAVIVDEQLNIGNGSVVYDADGNADAQQVGCIRCKWTPPYSGAAPSVQNIFTIQKDAASSFNRIWLYHTATLLFWQIANSSGATIVSQAETFSPVAGTTYEFELNYDLTTGATRLFSNGVQLGSTNTNTGARDSNIGYLRIGSDSSIFKLEDLIIFDSVQHTANYTPGYTVPEYRYTTTSVITPEMQHAGDGTIKLANTFSTTEAGSPKYTIQVGRSGNYLYWNGAAWSISDGSYAQANDATTFNANLSSLDVDGEIYGQFKIIFTGSNTISSVSNLVINMNVDIGYSTTNPTVAFVQTIDMESLSSFLEVTTKSGSDEIKYILSKDGAQYYYNGSAWVTSDGTYAKSNTATEIEANKATFTDTGVEVAITMLLHSADGTTTPQVTSVALTYDFWGGDITEPNKCIVYGTVYKADGTADSGVTIKCVLNSNSIVYNNELILENIPAIEAEADSNGYWEIELIETANMGNNEKWIFTFLSDAGRKIYKKSVPNQATASFVSL